MTWEVLYVDDGSRDGTDRAIERICAEDPRARGTLLSRNFGTSAALHPCLSGERRTSAKSAALAAAFRAVRGTLVCTMDADLQDDPAELPKLFAVLDQGYD